MREALLQADCGDLIGGGCDCLIPTQPPKAAIEARRKAANAGDHDHYHSVTNPANGEPAGERKTPPVVGNKGYRPGRKSARRHGKKRGK